MTEKGRDTAKQDDIFNGKERAGVLEFLGYPKGE